MQKEWLNFLREQYPVGSRIMLREMKDPYAPVPPGTKGTLDHIDDDGQFHMKWDNGRTLPLRIGEDSFSLLPPETTTMKLYMPLTAEVFVRDEWGCLEMDPTPLTAREILGQENAIMAAMRKYQETLYYTGADSLKDKLCSMVFTAEERNGRLWGVAECRVISELTQEELSALKEYITGQAADGWGEHLESQSIQTDEGDMVVHLWNSEDCWGVQTEEECFGSQIAAGLPELCYSVHESTGELIVIRRGECGYYPTDYNAPDKERNVELADRLNEKLGVDMWQRQAMEVGSICGWSVPGADPAKYQEQQGQSMQMGGL